MTDFPIIDAHHHFWDPGANYLPWLCDEPPIPFRYGDYRALRRPYLPDDYRRDSARFDVVGSVYVETEWDPRDPVGESRWVHGIADAHGLPNAVVAQAWLDREDVADVLAAQAAFPLVRGIRHKPAAAASPAAVQARAPGGMEDPAWRKGYALLAGHGLSFDLQVPWWHLHEAAALAREFPETQLILNHTGLPADRSPAGVDGWERAMAGLAAEPNVAVKISGLGLPGQPWRVTDNGPLVATVLSLFGVERCMFASNFPVDGLVAEFATILAGFREIVADLPAPQQRLLFHDNAVRYYRIAI